MAIPTITARPLSEEAARLRVDPATEAIPSARGSAVLAFVFIALSEYWLAPALFGVTNYAGAWSIVGYVLFVGFAVAVLGYVLLPLAARWRSADLDVRERRLFHGLWSGSLLVALLATRTVFPDAVLGSSSSAPSAAIATVYTPFGAWPSLVLDDPTLGVAASLNVVILTMLGFVAITWSASFILELRRRRLACTPSPRSISERASRWAAAGIWGPLGFVSGCASCSPVYLALLGIAAPGSAAAGYGFLPLVPWIGLSGLLEIVSLALALVVLRRVTSQRLVPGDEASGSPEGRP